MATDISAIQALLTSVENVNRRYKAVSRVQEEGGTTYNVFDVLGVTTYEVRLHSSIIASLLQPQGHGAGKGFLKAFLRMPRLALPDGFLNADRVTVEKEKQIGAVTDTDGGRIDLYLSDGSNSVIIENKIYASDQENQMLRYYNYAKKTGKGFVLVYLSLDGKAPGDSSLGGQLKEEDIKCLSYRDDIIPWLRECVRIAANLPYVRETLNQYIMTLKDLTDTDMPENNEIIDLLSSKENIEAMFSVYNNFSGSLNKIVKDFCETLKDRVADLGFRMETNTENMTDRYARFKFRRENWNNVCLALEFEKPNLGQLAIGFLKTNDNLSDIRKLDGVKKAADELSYYKDNNNWFWSYPDRNRNWNNPETIKMLFDGTMADWFVKVMEEVHAVAQAVGESDF